MSADPEHYPTSRSIDVSHAAKLDEKFRKRIRNDVEVRGYVSTASDAVADALPVALAVQPPTTPGKCVKLVHIVRHGNGIHNVMTDSWTELAKLGGSGHVAVQALFGLDAERAKPSGASYAPLVDALRDAPLTDKGWQEASATRQQVEAVGAKPSLLVVSPMRRAAETGIIVFPETSRVVAHDALHETSGLFSWDRRRDLTEIRADEKLKHVDWSMIHNESCPWWIEDRRETDLEMIRRLVDFMRWLREQPEEEIALASHSHIIHALLQCGLLVIPEGAMTINGMVADSWFITGEMRSFYLTWSDSKRKREDAC